MENIIRFKTEKEFIQEFGSRFDNIVKFGWNSSMNQLFGKLVPDSLYNRFVELAVGVIDEILLQPCDYNYELAGSGWFISRDMITLK